MWKKSGAREGHRLPGAAVLLHPGRGVQARPRPRAGPAPPSGRPHEDGHRGVRAGGGPGPAGDGRAATRQRHHDRVAPPHGHTRQGQDAGESVY